MPHPKVVYPKADELENLPALMCENYLYESKLLCEKLSKSATVLQVGSMDGERAIRLLKERPDLKFSGLEIEASLVELANKKTASAGFKVRSILGDITDPPNLPRFEYVICTNNTLGYIPNEKAALQNMAKI